MMTPAQEVANALTMILPTLYFIWDVAALGPDPGVLLMLLGSAMHLPVSFTYHLSVACGRYADRLDNDMRRLDQSVLHAASCIFALALSSWSWSYALALVPPNAAAVVWLWDPRTSNDGRRYRLTVPCVLAYCLPMLWCGHGGCFCAAFGVWLAGGVAGFAPGVNARYFGGWGHAIFHVSVVLHARAIAVSLRSRML